MAEYIDRERAEIIFRDARLALKPERCKDWSEYITRDMMLMNAEQAIHIIPAADVQPVRHGRWENINDLECFKCSCCGDANQPWGKDGAIMFSYCPNCGAKMDGGET